MLLKARLCSGFFVSLIWDLASASASGSKHPPGLILAPSAAPRVKEIFLFGFLEKISFKIRPSGCLLPEASFLGKKLNS